MSNMRDYILLEYGGVPEGAVLSSQLCPSCRGGVSGEQSMSVGRTDGLLWWRCHRNKCEFRGLNGSRNTGVGILTPAEHQKGRWNYETERLSKAWLSYLSERFRILDDVVDREWMWTDSYGGRVVMPVRNERNVTTAYTLRSYNPEEKRKALNHRVMEDTGQAWYQGCPYPSHILIVEDQPSALRASLATNVNSVALLGTHVPNTLLETIKYKYDYKPTIVVALDQDATPEAVKQVASLRHLYEKLKVYALEDDIKNLNEEEFLCTMNEAKDL